jgi:hypothetical protein
VANISYKENIVSSPIILPGCVGAWDLKPVHGKIKDVSGYGGHGTPTGFSGNDLYFKSILGSTFFGQCTNTVPYIDFGALAQFNFSKSIPFSINLFVKRSGTASGGHIFCKGSTTGARVTLYYSTSGGTYWSYWNDGANERYIKSLAYWYSSTAWHMITLTSNGVDVNGVKIYVDGWDATDTRTDTLVGDITNASSLKLNYGSAAAANREFYYAYPSVYNRELSAGEVSSLYKTYQKEAVVFKTVYEGVSTTANISTVGAPLDKTPFKVASGTWKISADTINGIPCKVIECVSAGSCYIDATLLNQGLTQPEGKWLFWFYKNAAGSNSSIQVITSTTAIPNESVGIAIDGTTAFNLRRRGVAAIITSAIFPGIRTYCKIEIDRTTNNYWRIWCNGVNAGGTTIGTINAGTPVSCKYLLLEAQASDKLVYASADGSMGIFKYALP